MTVTFCSIKNIYVRCFFLLTLIVLVAPAWSEDFSIKSANASFDETALTVDAQFKLKLSDAVTEALHNGINIRLTTNLDLYKPRRFQWDKKIARWSFDHDIHYHSLTDRYTLTNSQDGTNQSFSSLLELIRKIETFDFHTEIDSNSLPTSSKGYELKLRIALNNKSLPAPLRAMTYILPPWRLKSQVHEWHIDS